MSLSKIRGTEIGSDAVYHLGRAMAIVNKNIANFYCDPIIRKDKTIIVVAMLTHFEVRTLFASTLLVIIANMITLLDQIWFRS
jgi:hypothetical protein